MADSRIDNALFGNGIHAAVSQRRPHHREILSTDIQRTLPRVQIHGLHRIAVDAVHAKQKLRDASIAEVGLRGGSEHIFIHRQVASGKLGQAVVDEFPFGFDGGAWHQASGRDRRPR